MVIKSLHIIAFAGVRNRDISLSSGVNVIDGANESGKSSIATFIKFIFYGLSSKSSKGELSERQRYMNRETMRAEGFIVIKTSDGVQYRLERSLDSTHEKIRIVNQATGDTLSDIDPGEYFFGVPEEIFTETCFVAQASAVRPASAKVGRTAAQSSAIENLLSSADENIDISRAIKRIDDSRRELLHKRGDGGEISELRKKRASLESELEASSSKCEEIVSASASLQEISRRITVLEKTKQTYDSVFSAMEKLTAKKRLDELTETDGKIRDLSSRLKRFDSSPLGNGLEQRILYAEDAILDYDDACSIYDSHNFDDVTETEDDEPAPDSEEAVEQVYDASHGSKILFRLALGFIAAFAVFIAATVVMVIFSTGAEKITFALSAGALAVAVLMFILYGVKKRKLNKLLSDWDISSEDEIEDAVAERTDRLNYNREMSTLKTRITEKLDAARLRYDDAAETVAQLAEAARIPQSEDIYETIGKLKSAASDLALKRESMVSKLNNLTGQSQVLTKQLADLDRAKILDEYEQTVSTKAGQTALSMLKRKDSFSQITAKRKDTENALAASVKRKSDLELKLAQLGKLGRSPDEIKTLIQSLDDRIEELSLRHEAFALAKSSIEKAGENVRYSIIPKISASASKIISAATEKYSTMSLDSGFKCGIGTSDNTVASDFLSHGTSDLAYISLRLALADEVFSKENPVVIFDESFAHIDGERIRNIMRMLSVKGAEFQFLIFTCRDEERQAAMDLDCNLISL
ncbi:MAG: AAA family ATPase [Clostridia bacterium]|nr:AAA family ATPase [Clostridia bacterium]